LRRLDDYTVPAVGVWSGRRGGGGEGFELGEVTNDETIGGAADELMALEPAHDADHGFRRGPHHVRHVLPREPDTESDALLIRYAVAGDQLDEQSRQPLIGAIEREDLGFFLGFMKTVAEVLDDLQRGIRTSTQHVEIGFFAHPQDADVAHRLSGAGMGGAVEGGGVAAEEVARHQHLQRAFLAVRRGFHALHRAGLDDVEIFGRVAFAEDELTLPVVGFGQFIQYAPAVLGAQDVKKRNAVERITVRRIRGFT